MVSPRNSPRNIRSSSVFYNESSYSKIHRLLKEATKYKSKGERNAARAAVLKENEGNVRRARDKAVRLLLHTASNNADRIKEILELIES